VPERDIPLLRLQTTLRTICRDKIDGTDTVALDEAVLQDATIVEVHKLFGSGAAAPLGKNVAVSLVR
jgi:hypothetical protein